MIYKGPKVVIPKILRKQMIAKSHSSHLGQDACVRRARDVLYWPGMVTDIREEVEKCSVCAELSDKQQKEPLMSHEVPSLPWSKVAQDPFTLHGKNYLVTTDYYSDFFELDELPDMTAETLIELTKKHFANHGTPAEMVTDNGTQYTSQEFQEFARSWNFEHITTSPYHSQSNGKAESSVKIAKKLIKKTRGGDLQLALLEWRNTPDQAGYSPMQKLNSRRARTTMPITNALLKPRVVEGVKERKEQRHREAKRHYDRNARPLPELDIGQRVRLQTNPGSKIKPSPWSNTGTCVAKVAPRSYLIESDSGQTYRRNRKDIRTDRSCDGDQSHTQVHPQVQPEPVALATPAPPMQPRTPAKPPPPSRTPRAVKSPSTTGDKNTEAVVTKSGRVVKPVKKFDV